MAADENKAKSEQAERLHRFAHDIRNRLTGLREVLRHLAEPTPGIDAAELATFAEQQYFKALGEVESLLDDMHVERGIGTLTIMPLDPAALVSRALTDMRHRFVKKEQQVLTDLAPGLSVQGDDHCLTELIAALLSNASKFSPRGSTIQVTLAHEGASAMLRVSDTGAGLSATDLDRIFVRYAWLSSHSTEGEAQGRGTLARAARWATAHRGSLLAVSPGSGHGSTFVLELPLG
ncbi:MAG: HAMP domain-containing sensor histidine kinase [Flavobacteriales bacterium]